MTEKNLDNATLKLYVWIMNGKELIKIFQKNGWVLNRITGSHHIMIKENERSVPIPVHASKDIPNGLVQKILKAGKIKI